MLLKIAQLGQPVLRNPALPVLEEEIRSPAFQQWLRDMHETLLDAPGVGLAAPQVFMARRVFLGAVLPPPPGDEFPTIETFINPRITEVSAEKASAWEGCLSFPELMVLVPRHRAVRIEFLDAQAQLRSLVLQDFQARVVQHELDHLDGILTIDRAATTRDIVKASEIDTVLAERKKKS